GGGPGAGRGGRGRGGRGGGGAGGAGRAEPRPRLGGEAVEPAGGGERHVAIDEAGEHEPPVEGQLRWRVLRDGRGDRADLAGGDRDVPASPGARQPPTPQ